MSSLIKAGEAIVDVASVQAFGRASFNAHAGEEQPSREALLEAKVVELEAALAAIELVMPEQIEEAREQGEQQGLKAKSDLEKKQIELLETAIEKAIQSWEARLGSLESTSIALARAVLEQVFADGEDRVETITSCVEARVQALRDHSALRVRVCSQDFQVNEEFERLRERLPGTIEVVCDDNLGSGECLVDLKLGHVELGPGAQWRRVVEFLDKLELETAR